MMGPLEALQVVAGITDIFAQERSQWSDVIGFYWIDAPPFEKGERVALAIVHVYAALIEPYKFDVREGLLSSISSLSIGGHLPAPVLEMLLSGIPLPDLHTSEFEVYEDLAGPRVRQP
jgi:hypothetical protein